MPTPTNLEIYNRVKEGITKEYKPSAYRSMLIVKAYKMIMENLGLKPYIGKKNPNEGLTRWIRESWRSDDGSIGYSHKNSVYRPTVRINSKTPTTFSELSPQEIAKAKREKQTTGRVRRFKS
jgi:hypothetical protein